MPRFEVIFEVKNKSNGSENANQELYSRVERRQFDAIDGSDAWMQVVREKETIKHEYESVRTLALSTDIGAPFPFYRSF